MSYTIKGTEASLLKGQSDLATPAQTTTTGSVLGGLVGGLASGVGAYYGAACFAGRTPVITGHGWDNIDDIEVGEMVMSYDFDEHIAVPAKVINVSRDKISDDDYYVIELPFEFVDGHAIIWFGSHHSREIITTASQPFVTATGLVKACDLKDGDKILTMGRVLEEEPFEPYHVFDKECSSCGKFVPITKITKTEGKCYVYDLTVEGSNTYFAGGCLALGGGSNK